MDKLPITKNHDYNDIDNFIGYITIKDGEWIAFFEDYIARQDLPFDCGFSAIDKRTDEDGNEYYKEIKIYNISL